MTKNFIQILVLKIEICSILEMAKKKECGSFSAISILLLLMLRKVKMPSFSHSQVSFIIQLVWQTIGISIEIFRDEKLQKTETFYL